MEIDFCAYLGDPAYQEAHEVTLADDYVVLDAVSQLGQANSGSPPRSWLS